MTSDKLQKLIDQRDEISSNVKFIGKLNPNCKLVLTPEIGLVSNSWYQSLYRSLFGEDSRESALSFCKHTIQKAFDLLSHLKNSDKKSDQIIAKNLIKDLVECKTGLDNLKILYKTDVKLSCDIDILIEYTSAKLEDLDSDCTGGNVNWTDIAKLYGKKENQEDLKNIKNLEEVVVEEKKVEEKEEKPEEKPEVKEEAKPEVKEEVKEEVKPEVKEEVKPEVKEEVKEEVKPEVVKAVPVEQNAAKPTPVVAKTVTQPVKPVPTPVVAKPIVKPNLPKSQPIPIPQPQIKK